MILIAFVVASFFGAVCFRSIHSSFLVRFLFCFGSVVFGGLFVEGLFGS